MNAVRLCTIQCSITNNYNHMRKLLTELCPTDFVLELLTPTRSRKSFTGKCVWTAHYRGNCNIAGMNEFSKSVKRFRKKIPYEAKVIAYGRYGGPTYGIFVQYGNENCNCILDFRNDLTPFPMELTKIDETQKGSQEPRIILFLNRSQYDGVNISSSGDESGDESEDGFFCVEYVIQTIKLGSTAVGIRTSEGVAIAVESGLRADAHTSIDRTRYEYQSDQMSVECSAQAISSLTVQFGNNAADNGVAILFAGIDAGDPQLWHVDPFDTCIQYDAKAIGSGSENVEQDLQESCTPNMTIEEAVNLSLRTLKKVLKEKLSSENVEVVIVTPQRFQMYTKDEVQEIIEN